MSLVRKASARLQELFRGIETTLLYRHDLAMTPHLALSDGCEIRPLQRSEAHLLDSIAPLNQGEALKRLDSGDCFIGLVEGKPAHYSWVQTTGKHHLEYAARTMAIQDGDLWIYHCETARWARGKRLYPCALTTILERYRGLGFRRAWIYTTMNNTNSQKGIDRAGFVLDRRLRALYIAGFALPLPHS